jgi:hypothetical protein
MMRNGQAVEVVLDVTPESVMVVESVSAHATRTLLALWGRVKLGPT